MCVAANKLPSLQCFHLVLVPRRAWELSCQLASNVLGRLRTTKRRTPTAKTLSWDNYFIGVPLKVRNAALQHY